jgi:hypothetical protein
MRGEQDCKHPRDLCRHPGNRLDQKGSLTLPGYDFGFARRVGRNFRESESAKREQAGGQWRGGKDDDDKLLVICLTSMAIQEKRAMGPSKAPFRSFP